MTEQPDTTTMSGAEFQRHAGTNTEQWAGAFIAAYAQADGLHTDADRIAFVAGWFRDYAEVRVAEEVGRVTARLVPRQE